MAPDTQDQQLLDPVDRAIIEALQVSPRATWTAVGEVVGVDPVTVARRWTRLSESGVAWVTATGAAAPDGGGAAALVDIAVASEHLDAAARHIAADPYVFTLERATGAHALTAIVGAPDMSRLVGQSLERIERTPGVRAVEIHLVTRIFLEASRWRMRGLTPAQSSRLKELAPAPPARPGRGAPPDEVVMGILAADGRASGTDIAAALGTSVHTARRRLDRVLASGRLVFRCDVAQPFTGWPVCATFRATVAPARAGAIAQTLSSLPEIRMCAACTGPHNIQISVWLRSVDDVHRLESLLAERLPDLHIADRVIVLRQYKASGRILDASGRATPVLPTAPTPSETPPE
ncbi:Lrp/AsnC family transcriptional regulator [Streptomyces poriferorum]|uniref:Lrp/AsnC family transcriptional regulator n=1 Tax=Streptomyces poriferorum TaxID=2798799 RepID=A0ABY9IPI2_9ACTN|nr:MULTISPECIES: Lrp/AsnC family transcriptional regulator [unclassified Streptomyces]MDP5313767.1 Lrp/AsnC family transcriptional regulator [Streptomyces sp. Alt4]WLQ57277.1 Lrp/AsnC family transcriptional regulator [Streptomyces sp. Alt2]